MNNKDERISDMEPLLVSLCQNSSQTENLSHLHLHAFLLRRESKPLCETCNCQLSVEHDLLSCKDYDNIRSLYFNFSTLYELFEKLVHCVL